MKIDLSMIAKSINEETEAEVEISLDMFRSRLGNFPITEKAPVTLHIRNEENAVVRIFGTVSVTVKVPCARCLEEVFVPVRFDIDKQLRIAGTEDSPDAGALIDDEMEETDYLHGFELDADQLIHDEILLNWPMKVLCRDDCKGICRVCGMNLNKGACSCPETEPDPRMAAIQDIFNEFKEV